MAAAGGGSKLGFPLFLQEALSGIFESISSPSFDRYIAIVECWWFGNRSSPWTPPSAASIIWNSWVSVSWQIVKGIFFLFNRSHYIEYLVRLIGRNRLDPLPILDLTDVWQELRRHGRALPDRGPWDTDAIYLGICSKVKIDVKFIRGL